LTEHILEVRTVPVGPFQANCFLARAGEDVVIIDPGAEPDRIASLLDAWGVPPRAIVLTHAHVDHVGGVADLVRRYGIPVYLHPDDLPLYERASEHGAMFGVPVEAPPPPDHWLEHGEGLTFGDIEFGVRHAPGHSPGGVVLVGESEAFVGDCVSAAGHDPVFRPRAGDHRSSRSRVESVPERERGLGLMRGETGQGSD
jgi:glyoxylase-like metal-dependent hydrolase (beta-lactamase superfamily II)